MLVLKIALGVFVGALGALLAYDALSTYQMQRMLGHAAPFGLKADVVSARFHQDRRLTGADAERVRAMAIPANPASTAGVIEWTGNPGSRVTVPR